MDFNANQQSESSDSKHKVLVVEDNDVNQEVICFILQHLGCHAVLAENAETAINILRTETFDMVLMDCGLPEMDGLQCTRIIRGELGLKDLAIVAVTAHALPEDYEKCMESGMSDYICKPIEQKDLKAAIDKWCK